MHLPFSANSKKYWPIGLLIIIELLLFATNFKPGTFLMGWDNVMPELNFGAAFKTNIFGVWINYRGLGLPDGMGHAANLIHTLFLWLLSLALPQNILRYIFHFLMHLVGMVGMLTLLKELKMVKSEEKNNNALAFIGALFYGLNLITIQMFYTPLEAFSVHFAALPWLAYSFLNYLQKPHRNTLLLFISISILSTAQFFIPTLLLPTTLLLLTVSLPFIRQWKHILIAALTFILVNAFWLIPYLYNLPHNAPIIQNAKINQMSSAEVYLRNRAFGDIINVLTFKGFMLDFEDVNHEGMPIYVMDAWRQWVDQPSQRALSIGFAVLMMLGILKLATSKERKTRATIIILWILSFVFLANNTPTLSEITGILRDRVPFFSEAYRFPFTKFSLLFAFSGSILTVWGLRAIFEAIRLTSQQTKANLGILIVAAVLWASLPAFQGQFFYNALKISIPKDYIRLFAYMDKLDHDGRTVYLPQPSYWSWKHYRWGYVGSGFLWYGLSQPLLDRAFDPWSNANENYYWELSYALYKKDATLLASVLRKYDVRYVIVDASLLSLGNDRALLSEDIPFLLAESGVTKVQQLGTLSVYTTPLVVTPHLRFVTNIPTVGPAYAWTDHDRAFALLGDYQVTAGQPMITFPYRGLFTKRAISEREVNITAHASTFTIAPSDPRYEQFTTTIDTTQSAFDSETSGLLTPQSVTSCGFLKRGNASASLTDENALRLSAQDQRACLSYTVDTLEQNRGYLVAVTSRHEQGRPLMLSLINATAKHVEIESYLSHPDGSWYTDYFILPPLAPDGLGYTIYFTNDSIGVTQTVNDIKRIVFYAIPYQEMVNTHVVQQVKIPDNTVTVVNDQAYNDGWIAYAMPKSGPFWTGNFLSSHVLVNNWENGWRTSENIVATSNIIVIYWPQILEWAGLLLIPLITVITLKYRMLNSTLK